MAYAEKRGKGPTPWRVKYKRPDGTEASEPKFATKTAALAWGREQESQIRRGGWTDPRTGEMTLAEWIEQHWWRGNAKGLALNTRSNYRQVIDAYILPAFGDRPLNTLTSPTEINAWEIELKRAKPGAAHNARGRLCTILNDAVAEGRMTFNAARRPGRHRGRKVNVAGRKQSKPTATPLQVLLFAERCALVTGRAEDFVKIVTIFYTGMRWSEVVGLRPEFVTPGLIRVDWQLFKNGNVFFASPPKDGSMRDIHTPLFLDRLLREELTATRCTHPRPRLEDLPELADEHDVPCPGGVRYLFLSKQGRHPQNRTYASKVFDPAADALWPMRYDRKQLGRRRVLVDLAAGWPGVPIPAWPAAVPGEEWSVPRGTGYRPVDLDEVFPATWLPVLPGAHPHMGKHTHRTWMDSDGIADVLMHARLGHDMNGMPAVYSHVIPEMVATLMMALEGRWESSLRQRAAIDPRSPVPLLDRLLAPYRRGSAGVAGSGSPKFLPTTANDLSSGDLTA